MAHHHFTPTHYHVAIGPHEPVLRIAVGDTVSTTTVDARGRDASDQQVTERGNPQTGPFYVEGAEPGDTLVVRFDRIWPNRKRGWTGTAIAPNVLDPGFRPGFADEVELAEWEVDLAKGIARLASPPSPLGRLELPLAPMLGCFGVAPPRGQAISTATSSTHGGNMDYRGFVQGAKVYFPVFVPGALLHVGDCHAVQGDGEIVGTGIEISAEVTFGVDLIKGRQINWPRAENEDYIMTVGNARPLDQCAQHATTEMVRWLTSDFGLDARTAHLLLGQCVQYDLGNIYDPAYTMVCKVSKKVLEGIGAVRR
ncbi:MAG: acetamidase/formamidase family protein [Candidatus Latescibacteria bacterium]|nr:acetamidase/formamidase family protein [Candidatus Latescibacterota bacterium]